MQQLCSSLLAAAFLLAPCIALNSTGNLGSVNSAAPAVQLHVERSSPADLELGGNLAGLPPGTTRYITRDELLALPQETYTVTDDSNFAGPTRISGVLREELVRRLGAAKGSGLIVALSHDQYRAHYPRAYMKAHNPLLVLTINGRSPADWPMDAEGHDRYRPLHGFAS